MNRTEQIWVRVVAAALVLAAAGASVVRLTDGRDQTNDAAVAGNVHPVSARITGTVIELRTDDNRHVRRGDVLVVLDPTDFQVRIDQASAQISQGEAQVSAAESQIAQARAAIAGAQANVERTKLDLDRATALIGETPRGISRQEYDAAKASHDGAVAALAGARAGLSASLANRQAALALVAAAKASHQDANLALGYARIVAPVDGFVGRRSVEVGARINAGQTLLSIVSDDLWVVANYKETQLHGIAVGAPVRIAVDALPHVKLRGRVESFSPASGAQFSLLPPDNATGNFTKVVQRVPVKIRIAREDLVRYRPRLMPGLSVTTEIGPRAQRP